VLFFSSGFFSRLRLKKKTARKKKRMFAHQTPWKFDADRQQMVHAEHPERTIKGLCRPLRRTYFSRFRFVGPSAASPTSTTTRRKTSGRRGGRTFDQQLTNFFSAGFFSSGSGRSKKDRSKKDGSKKKEYHAESRAIQKKKKKKHWGLDKYLAFLRQHEYDIVDVQVGVGDFSLARRPLATMVDAIVQCRRRRPEQYGVVLIENKCRQTAGYTNASASSQKTMQPPFHHLPNTPYMQDQLQLAFTKRLFEQTFPTVPVVGAMVLRIHPAGIAHYPLDDRLWTLPALVFQSLLF